MGTRLYRTALRFAVGLLALPLAACTNRPAAHPERLAFFCPDYGTCREQFRAGAAAFVGSLPESARTKAEIGRWQVPSRTDEDLQIDYLYVPATERPENLVIVSSGVHGVEGLAGSSLQALFLSEIAPRLDRSRLGLLLIHAINPYGMKYVRRVAESNVDLNRNFDVDRKLFAIRNAGYAKLDPILNPVEPATEGWLADAAFFLRVATLLMREPLQTLRQATLGGQYQFPQGLYFGGYDFEPQKEILEGPIRAWAKPYRNVLILDLHTGYGRRGVLHLFPSAYRDPRAQTATHRVFAGFPIEDPHSDEFYDNHGDFSTYVSALLLGDGKLAVPMTLEYGTYDNTGYLHGIESIRRMVVENQAHWHGVDGEATTRAIRREFVELYYPESASWKQAIADVSADRIPVFLRAFAELGDGTSR
jgi:hypothetical protein